MWELIELRQNRFVLREQVLSSGDQYVRFELRERVARNLQGLHELGTAAMRRTRGNPRGHRHSGTAELLAQVRSLLTGQNLCGPVHFAGQGNGGVPYGQVSMAYGGVHALRASQRSRLIGRTCRTEPLLARS